MVRPKVDADSVAPLRRKTRRRGADAATTSSHNQYHFRLNQPLFSWPDSIEVDVDCVVKPRRCQDWIRAAALVAEA
jgi:hypothetical protein